MSDPTAWQRAAPGQAPGWTPPPKPGLIPLRPLTFGELLSAPFQLLRRNPGALFGPAILIQAIVLIASFVLIGVATGLFSYRAERAAAADQSAVAAGGIAMMILAVLVAVLLNIVGAALLQAITVIDVANGTLGHRPRARQLWAATRGRRWALIGYLALLSAASVVLLLALGGIVTLTVVLGVNTGGFVRGAVITSGVLIGVLAAAGAAVLAAWLWGRTSLAPNVIMIERVGVRAALARSWRLTHRAFWRVFGAQALVIVICQVASQIVVTPLSLLLPVLSGLLFPLGTGDDLSGGGIVAGLASYALTLAVSLVVGTVITIVQAATGSVVYIDQRMRLEGLDIALTRHVESVQAGRPVGDPFAPIG